MKEGGTCLPLFLFASELFQPFLFGDFGVQPRAPIPRLPAFPLGHEERVANQVHRAEKTDRRAEEEECAKGIRSVGLRAHAPRLDPDRCRLGFSARAASPAGRAPGASGSRASR